MRKRKSLGIRIQLPTRVRIRFVELKGKGKIRFVKFYHSNSMRQVAALVWIIRTNFHVWIAHMELESILTWIDPIPIPCVDCGL